MLYLSIQLLPVNYIHRKEAEIYEQYKYVHSSVYNFKVEEAKVTEKKINEAREHYRPAASRASLLYFILNDLEKINPLYQFSLKVIVS